MNAHSVANSRAQEQALSAPFLIENLDLVREIAALADERGTAMDEIVALAIRDYAHRHSLSSPAPEWLRRFWNEHPLPLPTGLMADKRFYDALSGDL